MSLRNYIKLTWWQVALISIAASAIGGLVSGRSSKKERKVYNEEFQQAPWSPPGWVFAPAWTINNFFVLLGLQRLLLSNISDRKKLLVLQAMIWVIFFSFGYIYILIKKVRLLLLYGQYLIRHLP